MKILAMNIFSVVAAVIAGIGMMRDVKGWGWFLFAGLVAACAAFAPK